jgi:predicted HNH restriction endonuclease
MYLAPLNADYFFKKVFSEPKIAKQFLEDFLDKTIESIELLRVDHKLTDDSTVLSFDFRCKIAGEYSIIEMQQWYKSDVVKRFYVYHSVNTALQLAEIPTRKIQMNNNKTYTLKDYSPLLPVTTLIWMSNDNLYFEEDFIAFSTFPEETANFVRDKKLWQMPLDIAHLMNFREKVLEALDNNAKDLQFLQQNRLIYAFQKNIVKNKKYSKYFAWFDLAERSKNSHNTKADFELYENEAKFMEVMHRLSTTSMKSGEAQIAEDYENMIELYRFFENEWKEDFKIEVRQELRAQVKEEVKAEVKEEVKAEVKEEVKAEVKEEVRTEAIENKILSAYSRNIQPSLIADVFGLTLEEVLSIIAKHSA